MRRNPELAKMIIKELGGQKSTGELCGLTQPAIHHWITRGIPAGWLAYLREKFPHLRAWTLAPAQEVANGK